MPVHWTGRMCNMKEINKIAKEENLIVIEVQLGTYFGEDDIIRISDPYNR